MMTKKLLLGLAPLAMIALVLVLVLRGGSPQAQADSPHAGLNFHLAVDTNGSAPDDCDTLDSTGSVPTKCSVALSTAFTVKIYLDTLGGLSYAGFDILTTFSNSNLTYKNNADANPWPSCVFEAIAPPAAGSQGLGCTIGVSPPNNVPSTYTGLIATVGFTCGAVNSFGSVTLVHGPGTTELTDGGADKHSEGNGTSETLVITCGTPPTSTATKTNTPTATRTPTITNTPTKTNTPTVTPTPTNTPTATPLPSNQPDVTITKTDSPDPVAAGGIITYSLVVKNIGQQTATGVFGGDVLPPEVVFISANSSGATCTHDGSLTGGVVSCAVTNPMAQNDQVKIVIQVTAPTPVADEHITNLAVAFAANEPFFNQGNNQDVEQTVVLSPRPDLTLTKVDLTDPIVSGAPEVYSLTVTNIGPEAAQDVVIKDNLPPGTVYNDAGSDAACDPGAGPDPDVGTVDVVCTLGTVAGQVTVQIAITGPVVTRDTLISNLAYVSSSNELFSQTGNNLDGEYTAVIAPDPDITIVKTGPAHVKRVQYFQYTLTITNIGLGDAFNVNVSDTLPTTSINSITQPMTLTSVVGGATCGALVSQTFTCNITELDVGGGPVVLTVNVRAPTVLVNTDLTNQSSVSDPDEPGEPVGNNSSNLLTQIRACFDVNGDNFMRIHDILQEVDHYFAEPPSPLYDLLYDYDGSGKVTIQDILTAVSHYYDDAPCVK